MKVCVVGAGSIGAWVAARLALAGNRVTALTSRGALHSLEVSEAGQAHTA